MAWWIALSILCAFSGGCWFGVVLISMATEYDHHSACEQSPNSMVVTNRCPACGHEWHHVSRSSI